MKISCCGKKYRSHSYMWLNRRDVSAMHLSSVVRVRHRCRAVSPAADLSVDDPRDARLPPRRSLQIADPHQARVCRRRTAVRSHLHLRAGGGRAPGRRARGWSGTDRPHVSLDGLRPARSPVQGQVQADQPHPRSYWRAPVPVPVSRLWKSVRAQREP